MAVCVMFVIVPCMTMIVTVIMMGMRGAVAMTITGIGSAFRIERSFDLDDARAEPFHHGFNHMVMPDAKTFTDNLGRQMTIAEMPRQPHKMCRIGCSDFQKMLRSGDHLDQPAIFQHESIAAAQGNRLFKIKQEFKAAGTHHRHAAAMTVVETEHDSICCCPGPTMMRTHLRCADHTIVLKMLLIGRQLSRV